MKRSTPTQREIAKRLIAEHNREQEAIALSKKLEEARAQEAARPRIGPKPPVYLPYVENEMFY